MNMNLSDVKDVATIAKPFIEPLVGVFISPYIKKLEKWLRDRGETKKIVDNYFESKFEDYLLSSYQRYSIMNVLIFPNQQIDIKSIYHPLTIVSAKNESNYKIDNFDFEILNSYQRILISDSAGMGKSTLMKWIGLSLIEQNLSVPILVELKRLTKDNSLLNEIFNQIDPLYKPFDRDLLFKLIEYGNFTILLDGFDEISYENRRSVIADIKDFIGKASKNKYILTSRKEESLSSFGDFQVFSIQPLGLNESFDIIRKYDEVSCLCIGEKLISDIEQKLKQVEEFLVNPFLVSLLYKTYSYNKDIPSKKSTFYDDVYSALYKHHDLSKDHFEREKKSGLDIYDFRLVLRQFAFDTAKIIKVEYTNVEVLKLIKDAKNATGMEFKESNYLLDLESNVPLFVRDGHLIKWAHKSLQDYFAAEWISNNPKKEEIIVKIFESRKRNYINILDFLYELEPKIFKKVIILKLICRYIKHYEESFSNSIVAPEASVALRKALTFGHAMVIINKNRVGVKSQSWTFDWEKSQELFSLQFPDYSLSTISENMTFPQMQHLVGTSFDQAIIDILLRKNEDLFWEPSRNDRPLDMGFILDKNTTYSMNDDSITSIFNTRKNFAKSTNYFFDNLIVRNQKVLLDYRKCLKMKKKIEKEISWDLSSDIFVGI